MKRIITLLLTFALLLSAMSCGSESVTPDTGDSNNESASELDTQAPETDPSEAKDDLPPLDFGGYTFRMVGRNDNFVYIYELGAEEQNGELVNDAAYTRNMNVAERLNVNFSLTYRGWEDGNKHVRQAILANEDAYDLVINATWNIPSLAAENLLLDWHDLDYVDFSKPWWDSEANSELSVADHTYLAIGDLCMSDIGILMCIFYNRTLAEKYSLENMYTVVNEGRWTFDYFNNTVKGISADLNGDGIMDDKDEYGFGNNRGSTLQPFVFSLGARYSTKNENDIPVVSMNTESFISAFEKIYSLHCENEGVYCLGNFEVPRKMFANGQIVFNTGAVYHISTLYRDMNDSVGILPFPKDEGMDKYYTCHDPNVSLLGVPITVSDPSRTGAIIEALCAESYRVLTPAFYETALKVKYSRDDETVQTLDMLRQGATFDFVLLYSELAGKLSGAVQNLVSNNSSDFVSYYAQNAPADIAALDELISKYQNLK